MEILNKFCLSTKLKVGKLSRGMQMRLMLAFAFSHNAKLLILDGPTGGLDPLARDELLEMLQDYIKDGEKSVLFSTHITTDLQRVADYITFLEHGRLVFTGYVDDLLQEYMLIKGAPDELTPELNAYMLDIPTIDDIVIFISKRGEDL